MCHKRSVSVLYWSLGVLSQGGGMFGTFVTSFYLQFSQDGSQWYTYKEFVPGARPRAKVPTANHSKQLSHPFLDLQSDVLFNSLQVFLGNHDDEGVTESRLDRIVSAQFVRLLPHDFQNGIYLRLEIMGCGDGW